MLGTDNGTRRARSNKILDVARHAFPANACSAHSSQSSVCAWVTGVAAMEFVKVVQGFSPQEVSPHIRIYGPAEQAHLLLDRFVLAFTV